jgi:hypothetical protein
MPTDASQEPNKAAPLATQLSARSCQGKALCGISQQKIPASIKASGDSFLLTGLRAGYFLK